MALNLTKNIWKNVCQVYGFFLVSLLFVPSWLSAVSKVSAHALSLFFLCTGHFKFEQWHFGITSNHFNYLGVQ